MTVTDCSPIRERAERAAREVTAVTVVVPAAGVAFPAQAYDPMWDATLVVVPEDRYADDQMPADIRPGDLGPHGAAACATLTGLWRWSDDALLDGVELSGGGRSSIHVVSSAGRVLDGGMLADQVADMALTVQHSWPLPEGAIPPARPAEQPEVVITDVADQLIAKHGLEFRPTSQPAPTPPTKLNLWSGLKLFLTTFVGIMRATPTWYVSKARRRVEQGMLDFFQNRTYGPESSVVLTLRGQTAGEWRSPSSAEQVYDAIRSAKLPGTDTIVAEPALWEDAMTSIAGTVDAGEMPDGITGPTMGASRLVVLSPGAVAPSPFGPDASFDAKELGQGRVVRSADPRAASNLALILDQHRQYDERVSSGESPAAQRLAELQAWVRERSATFTWRIGEAISSAADAAAVELAVALETLARGEPDLGESEEDQVLRRRLRRMVLWFCLAAVAAVALVVYAVREDWAADPQAIGVGVLVVLGLLLLAVVKFMGIVHRLTQNQFARKRAHEAWLLAHEQAQSAATQVTRFSALYWQHLDWSEIIAGVVHRPWGAPRAVSRPSAAAVPDDRPRSMAVGVASSVDLQVQRAISTAQKLVITKGWVAALLAQVQELSRRRYLALTSSEPDQVHAARDTLQSGTVLHRHALSGDEIRSPRGALHQDVMTGQFVDELRERQLAQVTAALLETPLRELYSAVAVGGPLDDATEPDAESFLANVRSDPGRRAELPFSLFRDQSVRERAAQSVIALPPHLSPGDDHLRTRVRHVPGSPTVFCSLRLDVSRPLGLDDLVVREQEVMPSAPETGSSTPPPLL